MKKIKTLVFLLSLFLFAFAFYSCSTDDDEGVTIPGRIAQFFADYNNGDNNIRFNFVGSWANSDITTWNMFFFGSPNTHKNISYSLIEANEAMSLARVNISGADSNNGTRHFHMVNANGNWLISNITSP